MRRPRCACADPGRKLPQRSPSNGTTWRDSWLLYQFAGGPDDDTHIDGSRVWYATVKSPPLVFSVQTQAVNTNLLTGFGVLMAVFVTGLSGLLWRLM